MKVIIVEDSRLARNELKELLLNFPEIEVIVEATEVDEAYKLISSNKIDIIFLDINMPGKNGFALLEMLDYVPFIIFTTAYDEYALKSFEYNTIDYLLKPIKKEALERAVTKAFSLISKRNNNKKNDSLNRIFIKDNDKCWIVNIEDIIIFESEGNYSRVFFSTYKPLIYKSLNLIEERIDNNLFFRANRKQIINLNFIKNIKPTIGNSYIITMNNDKTVDLSRRAAFHLKEILSF